ncbi:putative F-box domain, leucine-rich repeat domain superfamily, F-box-like domain superfamily [Helianthus annuus]|uniref:F-box domain, leucine-rich repeat domain superfamily, F-box-like domain superfamily n=1 Tax=Helianthus annuus TaxID=4232 RepID=A0A9K3DGL4_HELAN|nr:putative F-box domain, leucine-rich repeat domain superfamily, F-box-like domain superfamily [Helianthus annuus]KAJ0811671.1 putative F-box domain, leucine-rich repeat domain superfamily, F-box-like domain superfamily [Helianthus annuus]
MDPRHGKMRMNVEGDRLSSLPDDLIHKILAFLPIKDAIETSVLSSRWRFIWTSMPYLNLSSEDFYTLPKFSKFVTHVLSRRNNLTEVYSLKLTFRGKASQVFVKRILNYAFSHNVQQLNVVWLDVNSNMTFPLSLFSSKSLNSLTMQIVKRNHLMETCLTSISELPTLTTLDLHSVTLCDDEDDKCSGIFSKCANLKNLTLRDFATESDGLSIFHPRLANLTLENDNFVKVVNVVAPQLENLTIRYCYAEHVISSPHLASFLYEGYHPLNLSTDGFHSLEKADVGISCLQGTNAHPIVCLLQHLRSAKFLTLNLETVETLSSSLDLNLHQPSPFVNLKSLKIYPLTTYSWNPASKKVAISTELKSYLLDGSPGATFTMVLREEIEARKLIAKLGVLLEKEKDNTKTSSACVERGEAPVESHKPKTEKKLKIGGNVAQIKGYWEDLGVQIEQRNKTRLTMSLVK